MLNVDPARVSLRYDGGFRDPLIEQIARNIQAEMLDPAPAGKMLAETLASALGAHVLRNHSNLDSASVSLPAARGALDPRRLQRVKDLIETNPGADLTIEALAKEACLSPFHFARAFKAATGVPPPSVRHRPPDRKGEVLDFGRTEPNRRNCLPVRVFLTGLLHEVVRTTCRSHPAGISSGLPLISSPWHPHSTANSQGTTGLQTGIASRR